MDTLTLARSFALAAVRFDTHAVRLQILTGDRLGDALLALGLPAPDLSAALAALVAQGHLTLGPVRLELRAIAPTDLVPLTRPSFAEAVDLAGLARADVAGVAAVTTRTVTAWRHRHGQPQATQACRLAAKLRLAVEAIDWRPAWALESAEALKS